MPAAGQVLKPRVRLGKEPGDCWEWIGSLNSLGYPGKTDGGKSTTGQRWLFQQLFGPLPAALSVRMKCGNRICMNPHHMEIVTLADAQRSGDNAVLLPGDVREILRMKKCRGPGVAKSLAERLGCSEQTIRDIWRGDTWRNRSPAIKPNNFSTETVAHPGV